MFKYTSEIQHKWLVPSLKKNSKSILSGQNTLIASGPGSGKTLAFLIPILNKIFYENDEISTDKNNDDNELFQNAGMVAYDQLFLNRGHLLLSEEEKS